MEASRAGGAIGHCTGCSRDGLEVAPRASHYERVLCDGCAARPFTITVPDDVASSNGTRPQQRRASRQERARAVGLTPASDISPRRVRWLWKHWIPLRGLTVVAGEPGLGKSTMTNAHLVARITRGLLDGEMYGEPADVLIASAEDDWETVIKPRLMAAGADLHRAHRVDVTGEDGAPALLTLPDDVALLDEAIERLHLEGRTVGMVVVDPIGAFLADGTDSHKDSHVRRALAPLADLAVRRDLVVLCVAHVNKDSSQRLLQRVNGAQAFGAAPRSVIGFARDPDDPDEDQGRERVIVHAKSNWGQYATSLAARIESRPVDTLDGPTEVGYLLVTGESSVTAGDLQANGLDDDATSIEEEILQELAGGAKPSREVKAALTGRAGCSSKTITRAAKRLEASGELTIEQGGFPRTTTWALTVETPAVGTPPVPPTVPTGDPPGFAGDSGRPGSSGDSEDTPRATPDELPLASPEEEALHARLRTGDAA
jgi:hypothetical protein